MEKERDDETLAKIIDTRIQLNMEIDKDERYWEQRARINWLQLGDKNIAFFHKSASIRKKTNTINKLETDEGKEVTDDSEISMAATNYFQGLFSSKGVGNLSYLLSGIETSISAEINSILLEKFSAEEIYSALKEMGPTKAPRHDGFPALFFQNFWHIVGPDVEAFCLGVLNDGEDFSSSKMTEIVLLPKISNPTNLVNFRPISLCTVLYKIVAKAIVNRL
ncbi:hypothetical protein J1N35_004499 [Gossypium stocksii]|uniref:Reverse transcriptase domain-containing protein n=1 Tax=Gossypium stocksii TaxID=47602 RepID=A0A9D4AHQ7_9ROSI|nr:hypothetical protein J1N35_004499 [Gossypium stocksii]